MKKYIILAGVPRAGKSTASQIAAKTLGYQHISMDSIIAGIEKVFPETDIDTEASVDPQRNLEHISSKIAPFIRAMMDSGEYDECDYGVIFDVYQLLPEDYVTYIDDEKCDIAYFYHLILHRKKDLEYYSYMTHRMIIPIFIRRKKNKESVQIL